MRLLSIKALCWLFFKNYKIAFSLGQKGHFLKVQVGGDSWRTDFAIPPFLWGHCLVSVFPVLMQVNPLSPSLAPPPPTHSCEISIIRNDHCTYIVIFFRRAICITWVLRWLDSVHLHWGLSSPLSPLVQTPAYSGTPLTPGPATAILPDANRAASRLPWCQATWASFQRQRETQSFLTTTIISLCLPACFPPSLLPCFIRDKVSSSPGWPDLAM